MMRKLRWWLIRKLAGTDSVVLNCSVSGPIAWKPYGTGGYALVSGNTPIPLASTTVNTFFNTTNSALQFQRYKSVTAAELSRKNDS